jgi:DnaD/phage-associated family protein
MAEVFLLAGENEQQGKLPSIPDMCWSLRVDPEQLLLDLQNLSVKGVEITELRGEDWWVTKFAKRQSPSPNAKRQKRYRENHRPSVTNNVTNNVIPDDDVTRYCMSSASGTLINLFKEYEREIGMLTPKISDELKCAEKDYNPEWIKAAIAEAARNNKRSWAYAHAILKRWKVDGFQSNNKGNGNNQQPSEPDPSTYASEVY